MKAPHERVHFYSIMKFSTHKRIKSYLVFVIILILFPNDEMLQITGGGSTAVTAASLVFPFHSSSHNPTIRSSSAGPTKTTTTSSTPNNTTNNRNLSADAPQGQSSASYNTQTFINCKPVPSSQCEICPTRSSDKEQSESSSSSSSASSQQSYDFSSSCDATGKHQLYQCQSFDTNNDRDDDDTSSSHNVKVYKSCHRTKWDEDYLMFRLQGICMALAFLSLKSVRREKVTSESLFDQRKRRMVQQRMMATTGNNHVTSGNGSSGGRDGSGTVGRYWKRESYHHHHQEMVPLKDTVGQDSFEDENDEEIGFGGTGRGMDDILEEHDEHGAAVKN
jgi:hypothetical protein